MIINWIIFAVFALLFIFSFLREKRLFRNAVYLSLMLITFVLAIFFTFYNSRLMQLVIVGSSLLIALGTTVTSIIFIISGIRSIKYEGFSLAHCLSILFGLSIWAFFGVIIMIGSIKKGPAFIELNILLFLLLAEMYILFTFISFIVYSWLYQMIPHKLDCDFIIVLGAGLIGNQVSPVLKKRLDKTYLAYKKLAKPAKIIVSGGKGSDEVMTEALAMKNYLVSLGVKETEIIMEDQSRNTMENLVNSKSIMDNLEDNKAYKCIFVTSDYHVFRTSLYAKKIGLKADGIGCKTAGHYWPNAVTREYAAIFFKYKLAPVILTILWALMVGLSAYLEHLR